MGTTRWTKDNLRHALTVLRQGRNPTAAVYDSIGADFFLAPAPGWLNIGLWEGPGTEEEAPFAVRRLVERLSSTLPKGGAVLDVGNGLGNQDPVISEVTRPRSLIAVNVTESQLRAGKRHLARASAKPIVADATRLPLRDSTFDGVICVEAAFHFPSRAAFFAEARRVLRPGGTLTMSDFTTERAPRGPLEVLAGFTQLRVWGLRPRAAATAGQIAAMARTAGFSQVEIELCGERTLDPILALTRRRLQRASDLPWSQRSAFRILLRQVELLRRRRSIDYMLLRAKAPR